MDRSVSKRKSSEPLHSEPRWPTQRGLPRYEALLGIDVARLLAGGGIWIDVGPGTEALPMLPFVDTAGVQLKCIGSHPRSLHPAIEFTQGNVPGDLDYLQRFAGKATLVTDVYASLSYADDPYLALGYCTLLLKHGGICGAFTELQRFGDLAAWDRGIQFFRTFLHTTLTFEAISILEDASQSMATALRVQAHRDGDVAIGLDELAAAIHESIGKPEITGTLWEATDNSAAIRKVGYRQA